MQVHVEITTQGINTGPTVSTFRYPPVNTNSRCIIFGNV